MRICVVVTVLGYLAHDRNESPTMESRMAFLLKTVMLVNCSGMGVLGSLSATIVMCYCVGCAVKEVQLRLNS
jgi:hypothetical protein